MAELKKTPLNGEHRALGAKMVDFGGWDMPVQYTSILDEHAAVRTRAGLFDVSHMGEVWIEGRQALDLVQFLSSNDASKLAVGQIQYSGLLTPRGCFVDDMLVHNDGESRFLLVVNASNTEKDYAWILSQAGRFDAKVTNRSPETAQIAIQGPRALGILQPLVKGLELSPIKYYWYGYGTVLGESCLVARTGYTGEDGFEIYCPPAFAPALWRALLEAGRADGLIPAGLGARDTLRLEACMALYGNDIDDTTTVLEADLGWILKLGKPGPFNGRTVLEKQKANGVTRRLVAFELTGRGIPRHGMDCLSGGTKVGVVTSGTQAPFLKKPLGMAYLPVALSPVGSVFEVDIRGKRVGAVVVPKPHYKRTK
ncbi:MAG: glycine cleavage system protein T [Acidobacteria bacterium 37-65-4]|nr:MAG: glycine cleavage system protein T [Acidobacteria bacterium 37-65-4]